MISKVIRLENCRIVQLASMKLLNSTRGLQSNSENHKSQIMARGLPKVTPINGVKHIILVSSGKGGVGKSTIAVNLALALKQVEPSNKVGLLDSDVFGPSIPQMMNLDEAPQMNSNRMIEPLQNYGIKCMSMGFLIESGAPVIWRGLMVMQALQKLMRQVNWNETDYLIVDTPPGTGDTHLSIVQNIPITGVILVTTPQSTAIKVTERGARMFQKLSVPLIGIAENMAYTVCSKCSTEIYPFGANTETNTEKLAKAINCMILEKVPLLHSISENNDEGKPIVMKDPTHPISESFRKLAKHVISFCANK